jgi:hypothetical protein
MEASCSYSSDLSLETRSSSRPTIRTCDVLTKPTQALDGGCLLEFFAAVGHLGL